MTTHNLLLALPFFVIVVGLVLAAWVYDRRQERMFNARVHELVDGARFTRAELRGRFAAELIAQRERHARERRELQGR